jgi:hypothetical protein
MNTDELRDAIHEGMSGSLSELERLVRIPSIAFPGYDPAPVRASAEATAEILEAAGVARGPQLVVTHAGPPPGVGEGGGPGGWTASLPSLWWTRATPAASKISAVASAEAWTGAGS